MTITDSWIRHCKNQYPREFAHPVRIKSAIRNDKVLIDTVKRWQEKGQPCYISVYSFDNWRSRPQSVVMDRIYFDLDSETNPQFAVDDSIKLIDGLKQHGVDTTCYFSGKKGVAVYIDFEPMHIAPENKKQVLSMAQLALTGKFGVRVDKDGGTLDTHVIGDINRVSRLPNTKHQSSGMYCVPVTLDELKEGIDNIREIAQKPRLDLPVMIHDNPIMPEYMRRIEQHVIRDREKQKKDSVLHGVIQKINRLNRATKPHSHNHKSREENIAQKLIDTLKSTGYLSHNQRIGLVWLLDDMDWTEQDIVDLFLSNASDASVEGGNITRRQVAYTINWKHGRH